eukprot:7441587-Lingulodinium_polyedra.AAC.1
MGSTPSRCAARFHRVSPGRGPTLWPRARMSCHSSPSMPSALTAALRGLRWISAWRAMRPRWGRLWRRG